jgi:hypothetical protein
LHIKVLTELFPITELIRGNIFYHLIDCGMQYIEQAFGHLPTHPSAPNFFSFSFLFRIGATFSKTLIQHFGTFLTNVKNFVLVPNLNYKN